MSSKNTSPADSSPPSPQPALNPNLGLQQHEPLSPRLPVKDGQEPFSIRIPFGVQGVRAARQGAHKYIFMASCVVGQ